MLTTQDLHHQYDGQVQFNFPDIDCQARETLLVLGQSGVGKSTLLHILAGILPPTTGEVLVSQTSIYTLKPRRRDTFRGSNIGLVFQKPHFVQAVSAKENLRLAQRFAGLRVDEQKINLLLTSLNISHRASANTFSMSQGEQQRLSIARALINNPKVILADEPTSALDDKNCEEVVSLLTTQAEAAGAALIIVTHDNRLKDLFSHQVTLN